MVKKITSLCLFFFFCFGLFAQGYCPLKINVSTEIGNCYNNAKISIDLVDHAGNLLDISTTDFTDFKYFCINTDGGDTTFSYSNVFLVAPGTFKVGVQAVCYYSTLSDSMYVRLEKDTTVTTATSYVTPVLSMVSHIASTTDDFGTVPSLSCANTGRIQLSITGGSFPYYVKVCDSHNMPIDTVIFYDHQYNGDNEDRFDYKDYYSIEGLASGTYNFYVWDGCDYFMPKVWQEITTDALPYVEHLCWYYYSGNGQDSNVVKTMAYIQKPSGFYASYASDVIEYRFIYPINGIYDTTEWKKMPAGEYNGTGRTTVLLYDTAYSASRYCDLFDSPIIFEARNTLCDEMPFTSSYTYSKPLTNNFSVWERLASDSSIIEPVQYDSCGYTTQKTTSFGHSEYLIGYNYSPISSYSTCSSYSNYARNNHYTNPLYWVYTDTLTHQVIKIDTISTISTSSRIGKEDVIPFYGDFADSSITIPVQRTLYDSKGCELYTQFDNLEFKKRINTTGGVHYNTWFQVNTTNSMGDYCCNTTRSVSLASSNTPPMLYLGNTIVELITSPLGNKYNFSATYNLLTGQWTIVKDSVSNLATITTSPNSINVRIYDYCLPSGLYTFRITTACSTYVVDRIASFNDTYEYIAERPEYEYTPNCTELFIKPISGKYTVLRHNTYTSSNNDHSVNEPYTNTSEQAAVFEIVSGPSDGYTNIAVGLNGTLRITRPGTYVLRMKPSGTYHCNPEFIYDTVVFTGGTVEYEYDYAYVCDSLSTTGFVRLKGKNGTPPYRYTLFSEPDAAGVILGENTSGIFNHIPLLDGQRISARIMDSCGAGFYANFTVFDIEKVSKSWFTGGAKVTEVCEGSFITVYALGKEDVFSYEWIGPNGFSSQTQQSELFIPRNSEEGYYKVTLLSTGCSSPIVDSVYINVNRAAKVTIAEEQSVCPGKEVQLTFTASGTGNVHYTIGHEENLVTTYQQYTNNDTYTFHPLAPGTFWVHEVHDDLCSYTLPEDTISITLKDQIATACDVISIPDTVCIDSVARLSAYSTLDVPYILHWYQDFEQTQLLQVDTILNSGDLGHYFIPQLNHDTTLYVTAFNNSHCETQYGTINRWMNMHNGHSSIRCGESIRFWDSGGLSQNYSHNESSIHVFTSTDGNPITLKFNAFNTEKDNDKLIVFSGAGTHPDSIIATLSSDLSGNLPADIVSNGSSLTVWFLSNSKTENTGWDAVISNNPYPHAATAKANEPTSVTLAPTTENAVPYNGSVTLCAAATGGKGEQYEYQWFISNDGLSWISTHTEITHDTAYYTLNNIIEQIFVRTIVKDASVDACSGYDTATYHIPVANIQLSLHLSVFIEDPCNTNCKAVLTVENNGTAAAENVVSHLHLPDILSLADSRDVLVTIDELPAGGSKTDTFPILFLARPNADTNILIKAQIWSCLQGDSVPETIYGDWNWQGNPRQVDEDTANVHIKSIFATDDYLLTTFDDEVCYNGNARLLASSSVDAPQYFKWYSDPSLQTLIKRDTIYHAGDFSHFDLDSLKRHTTLYVTVQNTDFCPPQMPGASDIKFDHPITDTILMGNGTTEIALNDHLKFYDSGGPDGKCNAYEDYIHTFHATDGVVKIRFNKYYGSSCSIYFYDGPDINSPLITRLSNGSTLSDFSFSSTTENLTIRFTSNSPLSYWDADIINPLMPTSKHAKASASVKAPTQPIEIISATDDEICYGNDALLTASANIAYPQYYVWYNADMTPVLFDTIHNGSSELHLPNQKRNAIYYVTVENDTTTCALSPYFGNRQLFLTSEMNLQNTFIKPNETIRFYDNGGPDNDMHYDNDVTYTFKTEPGYQIALQFNEIKVSFSGCIFTLYDGDSVDESNRLVYLNSPPQRQTTYISTGNSITIRVPHQNHGKGWDALAYVVEPVLLNTGIRHDTTHISPWHSYRFLDDGGYENNYSKNISQPLLHTFYSNLGNISATFRSWELYDKDTLYIYKGTSDDPAQLITSITGFRTSPITYNFNVNSVTFKFVGHNAFFSRKGWDMTLRTTPTTSLAQAHVLLKASYIDPNLVTTNDSICYGDDARLTAFSNTTTTPQYYTWYAPNGLDILQRDTLYSGHSELTLPQQTQNNSYWVTIAPEAACPIIPNTDTTFVENISVSIPEQHRTIFVSPADSILFTDAGGISNYYITQEPGIYTTTFTATNGHIKAAFESNTYNNLCDLDTLFVYDGTTDSILIFKASGTSFANKVFYSSGNSMTFIFKQKNYNLSYAGWYASIVCTNDSILAKATVTIKRPGSGREILSTNDTLCYNETAVLYASAPDVNYPQYYTWISQDKQNIIFQDTVDGISKTQSTLTLEHQRKDTLFYVTLKTDTVCPMRHVDGAFVPFTNNSTFLMTPDKANGTTPILCNDSIGFYDEGGKNSNYTNRYGDYYHTFTTDSGLQVQLTFTDFHTPQNRDILYIYDGPVVNSSTLIGSLSGSLSNMPITYLSSTGSLTVRWRSTGYNGYRGWAGHIKTNCTSVPEYSISHVHIKAPLTQTVLTATNDTVCYDNEAILTASSAIETPQYYTWWNNDQTILLHSDTVSTPGGISQFKLSHQTTESLYYVHVSNANNCPFIPEMHKTFRNLRPEILMNSLTDTTVTVTCSDSIPFYDNGGKDGYTLSTSNKTTYLRLTAEEGLQVVLHIDTLSLYNSSTYALRIYDGTSSAGPLLARLGGNQRNLTYTSSNGSLYLLWTPRINYMGWDGYITTDCDLFELAESNVHVLPAIPETTIYHTCCQSSTPLNYMGFNNIDISTVGTFTIDSVYTSRTNCDSVVTLQLTVNPEYLIPDTVNFCLFEGNETHKYHLDNNISISFGASGIHLNADNPNVTVDTIDADNGDFRLIMRTGLGCDSIIELHIDYQLVKRDTIVADTLHISGEDFYMDLAGHLFQVTEEGVLTFIDTVAASNGCDSITVRYLIVESPHNDTICAGELASYFWNGHPLPATTDAHGFYQFPGTRILFGIPVDTISYLQLTVNPEYNIIHNDTICSNELPYHWADTIFDAGTISGNYIFNRKTTLGCDSIVRLSLVVQELSIAISSVDESCGRLGSITVNAVGMSPIEYSLDGITFQSSNIFTNLTHGTYTVYVRDANNCTATGTVAIAADTKPAMSITCPPDVYMELDFGDCFLEINPTHIGIPNTYHSLSQPFVVTNDIPADNLYHEGENIITWIMTDVACGYADTCYQKVVITFPVCPDAVDCEGNIYHGVRIGCDCWTQRNLESQKYSDCSDIPCVYEYVSSSHPNVNENIDIFGRLYCYEAAIRDSADNGHGHIQGICPDGWYLPTPEKYIELNTYGAYALKSPLYWIPSGGDNSSGFSALPAGYYNDATNRFEGLLGETYFWSTSNVGNATTISVFKTFLNCDELIESQHTSGMGYSVRCIKEKAH